MIPPAHYSWLGLSSDSPLSPAVREVPRRKTRVPSRDHSVLSRPIHRAGETPDRERVAQSRGAAKQRVGTLPAAQSRTDAPHLSKAPLIPGPRGYPHVINQANCIIPSGTMHTRRMHKGSNTQSHTTRRLSTHRGAAALADENAATLEGNYMAVVITSAGIVEYQLSRVGCTPSLCVLCFSYRLIINSRAAK